MDIMNAKMHMKNNNQHKTRKYQDQTRRLTKNNLKIMKNTMNAWIFEKCKRFLKHAIDTKLKNWHKTQTRITKYFLFLWFYDFFVFLLFFSKVFFRKTKIKTNFWKIFENFFEKKIKRKLPNLSNKMNRQLSILEQSPATAPKTWWTKLWSSTMAPKAWCSQTWVTLCHNSAQLTSKCTGRPSNTLRE